jgi:hypothetical protein
MSNISKHRRTERILFQPVLMAAFLFLNCVGNTAGSAAFGAPEKTLSGQVSSFAGGPRVVNSRTDSYGGSFYTQEQRRAIFNSAGQAAQSQTQSNSYGGSFYRAVPATNFGITTFGRGSNPLGGPAHVTPNGIGAPGTRPLNFITPVGNGANAPLGLYGGTSFGSSSGGAVR